jgi:hypothetical protein
MDLNIEKMLKEQEKWIEEFQAMPSEFIDQEVEILVPEQPKCSCTHFVHFDDGIYLTRYICNKIIKVAFGKEVLLKDVMAYIELSDESFTKLNVRKMPTN